MQIGASPADQAEALAASGRVPGALLGRAAAAGNLNAAIVHANFTANGTGGPSQWGEAIELLRKLAGKNANAKRQLEIVNSMDLTETGDPKSVPEGELLSESPYVMLFSAAFTAAEC